MTSKDRGRDPLKVIGRAKGYSRKELLEGLPRHSKFSPHFVRQIKQLPEAMLRNSGSPLAKRFLKMMREVFREAYRAKQFTRTRMNDKGVLYGVVLLEHDVMDLVLKYFHERWPQCIICLYNEHAGKTGIINERGTIRKVSSLLDDVVKQVSKEREIKAHFKDIESSETQIFETFYNTQHIEQRTNPRYFKQMIPKKCYELPGMREGVERRFTPGNKKLDDFL